MSEHTELEDRLRTAVHAHAAGVQADDRSLDTIRTRVRTAKHRRRAALAGAGIAAAVALAVAVPRLGDEERIDIDSPGPTTTVVPPPSTTTPPGSSSTTVPAAPATIDADQVLWPDPAGELTADPVDAVRGFLSGPLGISDPPLSPFRETEPGVGEVDVYARGEAGQTLDRVASTVFLRRLDGEHWFVTGAASTDVEIDTPEPLATVSSPFTVSGRVLGYEGTVNVRMLDRFDGDGIESDPVVGTGGSQELGPFSVEVSFAATGTQRGVLYAQTDTGTSNGIPSFTAFPVRFSAAAPEGAPDGASANAGAEFGYPPLWPFSTQAEADAWRQQHAAQGTQPWHLDAEETALAFTTGYLGFGEIDQVVGRDVRDREAWVSVGYDAGSGPSTAAIVHLVRFGPGDDAPWEVVGTRDTDLTLEAPSYGSGVSSPVTVGGRITGVDESLRVQVRQASSEAPIGEACCSSRRWRGHAVGDHCVVLGRHGPGAHDRRLDRRARPRRRALRHHRRPAVTKSVVSALRCLADLNADQRVGVDRTPSMCPMSAVADLGRRARAASRVLATASTAAKDAALLTAADLLVERADDLIAANAGDIESEQAIGVGATVVDRLRLTQARIDGMAGGLRQVAGLADPVGEITEGWVRPNGLRIHKVRVPLGVVAIIYENRPNVTSDAFGLCLKSGNAAFLRGSSGAIRSNVAIAGVLREALAKAGLPQDALVLVEDTARERRRRVHATTRHGGLPDPAGRAVIDPLRSSTTPPSPT